MLLRLLGPVAADTAPDPALHCGGGLGGAGAGRLVSVETERHFHRARRMALQDKQHLIEEICAMPTRRTTLAGDWARR